GHGNVASTYDFALARYNQDGTLDQTFGTAGKQTTDFLGYADGATGVAIQPDGKIVVAGSAERDSTPATADLALARYNPDGTLDQTFGTNGLRITNLQGNNDDNDLARAVAIQADGRIVVAGNTERGLTSATGDFAIARYTSEPVSPDFTISFTPSSVSAQAGS